MTYTVAVATSDGVHVDVHFGQATRFCIIEVDEAGGTWREVGWREVPPQAAEAEAGQSCHARFDKTAEILHDVDGVWVEQIGPRAHRVMRAHGIEPLEVPHTIDEAVRGVNAFRARHASARVCS